jgi:CRP-like cAMP-binding protein
MTGTSTGAPDGQSLAAVLSELTPRRLARGARLYHEGDPADAAYFVHRGLVKLVKTAGNGFQALVALRGADGFVGEHAAIDGRPRLTGAVAVTDLSITTVPRGRLIAIVRDDPDLAEEMLIRFSGHLRAATQHLLELAASDAVALVAARLTQLVSDPIFEAIRTVQDETTMIEMPISQQELASWAGVSHRSVTSALRRLRAEGLVSTSRLAIDVHDPAALARRAAAGSSPAADDPTV